MKVGETIIEFNLQTSRSIPQNDGLCFMDGFVYTNHIEPVKLAVCDGIVSIVLIQHFFMVLHMVCCSFIKQGLRKRWMNAWIYPG